MIYSITLESKEVITIGLLFDGSEKLPFLGTGSMLDFYELGTVLEGRKVEANWLELMITMGHTSLAQILEFPKPLVDVDRENCF